MTKFSCAGDRVTIHVGDCRDILRELEPESVDACVTDPPYGLTFMGRGWDRGVPGVEFWREVYRVLKPGAHLLAFGGTRTYHRLASAIEDAGFEIRDQIAWVYGQGFPKSLDVSKAIEKRRLEDVAPTRVVCRFVRSAMDARGLRSRDLVHHFGNCHPRLIDHWAARDTDSQPSLPTPEQWSTLVRVLDLAGCNGFAAIDAEVMRLNARKGEFGANWHKREIVGAVEEWTDRSNYALTSRDGLRRGPAVSDEARAWAGWGTALKPALEPIVVARKPLDGTVAANVLRHGTGAINVDGCRVGAESTARRNRSEMGCGGGSLSREYATGSDAGRWPANLVHDGSDEVLALFPANAGASGKASGATLRGGNSSVARGRFNGLPEGREPAFYGDIGSAARFFYCAKASRRERGDGNNHETVKPIALMRWLVRLVTPPGGLVLDPFAGSGTTGIAAGLEGFRAILCEQSTEYAEIARGRLATWLDAPSVEDAESDDPGPLFAGL